MKIKDLKKGFEKETKGNIDYLLERQKIDILEQISEIMEKKGISKANLAKRLGTSKAYITKMLGLNTNFTLKSLVKLSNSIDMKISIHLHPAETKGLWVDIYKEITSPKSDPMYTFVKDPLNIEPPKKRKDHYAPQIRHEA
jgi:transcriptional regulator with XRE-family HTH domain